MKKLFKCIKAFTFLIVALLFVQNVNAASNPYPKYQESPFGGQIVSCTWYAWQQAHDRMGVDLPLWTYVQTWYTKASKAGYSVGKTPKVNSIMVWDYGDGFGGHAAYVTGVDGNNITFDEGGSPMTNDGIYIGNQLTMDDMSSFLVGFIYLDVPKKVEEEPETNNNTTINNNNNTSTNQTEKKKTVVKSSDNSLKSLLIEGLDFEFKSDKLEYQLEAEYDLSEITIKATANDSKATVVGNDHYQLAVGENNFTVKITAENSAVKEYKINIIRKDEEKVFEENNVTEETQEDTKLDTTKEESQKKNKVVYIITGISSIIIIAFGLVVYKIKKHK